MKRDRARFLRERVDAPARAPADGSAAVAVRRTLGREVGKCAARYILGLIVAVHVFFAAEPASSQPKKRRLSEPTRFIEAFPATVYYLFQWPNDKTLEGENRLDLDSAEVKYQKENATDWVKRVLDEKWLPPQDAEPICLRKEFNDRDTIRLAWKHEGFRVVVSQTSSVFALKITPLDDAGTGKTLDQRVAYTQDLAKQVFIDDSFMWPPRITTQENRVPIKGLKERIAAFSFDRAQIKELPGDKLVVGYEKSKKDLGIVPNWNYVEDPKSDDPVIGTTQAAHYWFRNVRWWNDGESVGFYFLKLDSVGPWAASYVGDIDVKWFRPPRVPTKRP